MDCSWGFGNNACDGGEEFRAYEWIIKHGGIATELEYGQYLGVVSWNWNLLYIIIHYYIIDRPKYYAFLLTCFGEQVGQYGNRNHGFWLV